MDQSAHIVPRSSLECAPIPRSAQLRRQTRSLIARVIARLFNLRDLSRSRGALARLNAEQLADIGLPPEVAAYEAERPIWDAPAHWLRK
jgi:uncharacterized protein YjiS (DUF1127 family)